MTSYLLFQQKPFHHGQSSGFVLITASILLIAVTLLATTLLSSAQLDTKMTTYALWHEQAILTTKGITEQAIKHEVNREDDNQNYFTIAAEQPFSLPSNHIDASVTAQSLLPNQSILSGGHTLCFSRLANSRFRCNKIQIQAQTDFGQQKQNQIVIISGINQEVY